MKVKVDEGYLEDSESVIERKKPARDNDDHENHDDDAHLQKLVRSVLNQWADQISRMSARNFEEI